MLPSKSSGPTRSTRTYARHSTTRFAPFAKVSDHPNIVTLYRPLSTPDGRPVLVLELCRESIAEQTQRLGPLDPADVVRARSRSQAPSRLLTGAAFSIAT